MGIWPKTYHVDAWIYVKYGLEELIVAHNKIAIFFLDNKQKKNTKAICELPLNSVIRPEVPFNWFKSQFA